MEQLRINVAEEPKPDEVEFVTQTGEFEPTAGG